MMKRIPVLAAALLVAGMTASGSEPVVKQTKLVGPFTGADAALHSDNASPHKIEYYGTDLGFTYAHDGKIHFLFGDTWAKESYAPIEKSTGARHDDGFGTIDLSEWPDPAAIGPDNIPRIKLGQYPNSAQMMAMDPGHAMDLGKTPMAGFTNGEGEFAIFNITKPRGCRTDHDCADGLTCDQGLGYAGTRFDQQEQLTLACVEETSVACQADTMVNESNEPIPSSGFCVDTTSSIWAQTRAGRVTSIGYRVTIGRRSPTEPRLYPHTQEWLTNKFSNVTARTVNDFVASRPAGQQDYRRASAMGEQRRVFLWGRPGFIGVNAHGRTLSLYFAWVDMPVGTDFEWKVNYYAGVDHEGAPRFSRNQQDAVPVDLDSTAAGVQSKEAHDLVQQMSVAWVEHLNKWVMFYGGGILRIPNDQFPECGLLQVFTRMDCKGVDVGNGAIRMRTADNPWGPWSPPQEVVVGGDPYNTPPTHQYAPGGVLNHPDCTARGCAPHTRTSFYNEREYGFLYAANIIESWVYPVGDDVMILWNASTWDPYRVVLFRTRIGP